MEESSPTGSILPPTVEQRTQVRMLVHWDGSLEGKCWPRAWDPECLSNCQKNSGYLNCRRCMLWSSVF